MWAIARPKQGILAEKQPWSEQALGHRRELTTQLLSSLFAERGLFMVQLPTFFIRGANMGNYPQWWTCREYSKKHI